MKNLFVCIMLVSATASFAGDVSKTDFLGFSHDGTAVGFQQYGVQDASGFPYCKVILVDTEKNSFIVAPSEVVLKTEQEILPKSVCANAQAKIKTHIEKLKLNPDLGNRNFSRLITDQGGQGVKSVTFGTFASSPSETPNTVRLIETETGIKNQFEIKTPLLKVILKTPEGEKVLQEDKILPSTRKSAYSYELEEGYSYENAKMSVHVFTIRYFTVGFEGPDVRTMVVAGVSKLKTKK